MFPIARKKPNLGKGLVSGIVAGIVASFVMKRFQELREQLLQLREQEKTDREGQSPQTRKAADGGGENATVRTAEKISEGVFDRPLREEEKKLAGPAVHYAFGTAVGALYGAIADVWPEATAAAGMPFGAAVWLGADEVALPVLKLSKKPNDYPLSTHAYGLASHVVYGATTELVRKVVRKAL